MTASVLLVGFQDQDNLGLRYLQSTVQHAGFASRIDIGAVFRRRGQIRVSHLRHIASSC